MSGKTKGIIGFIAVILIGILSYWGLSSYVYSSGTRTGIVTKISNKGYIFKTYEGELKTNAMLESFAPKEDFLFSVTDTSVYNQLQYVQANSIRATLHYEQHIIKPIWVGESVYIITQVAYPNAIKNIGQ